MKDSESANRGGGLAGSLKVIAGLCVFALALLAALLVLEIIPAAMFQQLMTKILLLALVAALATTALWLLIRPGKR